MGNEAFNIDQQGGTQSAENIDSTSITKTGFNFGDWVNRLIFVLTNPQTCWETIKNENVTIKGFYTTYLIPLALIPTVCVYVGGILFGVNIGGFSTSINIGSGLVHQILAFAGMLLSMYAIAMVIETLTPSFKGTIDRVGALKLIGYTMTPLGVAGLLNLVPILAPLGILFALYGLYIYFQGMVPMANIPVERKLGFFFTTLILGVITTVVISMVIALISPDLYATPDISKELGDAMKNLGQVLGGSN